MRFLRHQFSAWPWLLLASCASVAAKPTLLDDQFELPDGFHIYRAAQPELTGGSYDLTFDGQGRLLVGDGKAVRRLEDDDGDGVYDSQETIADGLGGRGPQGLLVYGDHLYAVGGDGVQLFSGYSSSAGGKLKHERRLGEPFHTGGDHAAHTVLRGLDGYVYSVTGDGGGTSGRKHITEESSPVLEERVASVFRFDPTGRKWECVGSGGRNPPSLGMNYLGELFSFDSDMEHHVGVPFYRPVRLHHWATGGDQGWQGVGAFPPYYIDNVPGVLDVGRGSPNWGVFYEHTQLPQNYRDAFIVCDYRWKSATSGAWATSGRLVAFHLERDGAKWKAEISDIAKAKAGAKDAFGKTINFALVDVDVAPDGSLFVSDHNQGVWRIFFDPSKTPAIPAIVPEAKPLTGTLSEILTLPQPAAEWSRLREEAIRRAAGLADGDKLRRAVFDETLPLRERLRAIRLLAPGFAVLPAEFMVQLAKTPDAEIRAQAAWLIGIRGKSGEHATLVRMLDDADPFVRRRAAEALSRFATAKANAKLIERLADPDRAVRYAAMTALAHRPSAEFAAAAAAQGSPQILMRLLVAAHLRKERPSGEDAVKIITRLANDPALNDEDMLDFLRVLDLYHREVESDPECQSLVTKFLLANFPHADRRMLWEQIRLLGSYRVHAAFSGLVDQLLGEKDHVTQFHIATTIGQIPLPPDGWDEKQRERLGEWLISTQTGWFAEFAGKGHQFPGFWATTLNQIGAHHGDLLAAIFARLVPGSQLHQQVALANIDTAPEADKIFIDRYRKAADPAERLSILSILQRINTPDSVAFLTGEYTSSKDPALRKSLLLGLAANSHQIDRPDIFLKALLESDDPQIAAACANWLVAYGKPLVDIAEPVGPEGAHAIYFRLLDLMSRDPASVAQFEHALVTLSGHRPTKFELSPLCIWTSLEQRVGDQAWFAKSFDIDGKALRGSLVITCDNEFIAHINGKRVAASTNVESPQRVDVVAALQAGVNLIAIEGKNIGGPAGLVASLSWTTADGKAGGLTTDRTWRVTKRPPADWQIHGATKGTWGFSLDVSGPTRNAIDAYNAFTGSNPGVDALATQEYWHKWYLDRYKKAFVARPVAKSASRADEQIHQLIAGTGEIKGDTEKGRAHYLRAGCFACHGGIGNRQTTIFGPALTGVTLRLKRDELADALVYPSKQVVGRFKATQLTTNDGRELSGFITEESDEFVSITDLQNQVTRLPRNTVKSIKAQDTSLMPARLLNGLSDEELRDLLAFLASLE